ncbi:DUF7507 domain-containing protein [Occultella kanbiaonis]|uniref:DUF7507 domain-containing protein n=1 Tax=Occultella kanbiaonis TaxID=2675754 RepID=UPI0012B98B91|nr:CARDB domain-containing protein [Occultella kanbiaonis]
MRAKRVLGAALVTVLCALGVTFATPTAQEAFADPPTTGTTIVSETFTGASVTDAAWQPLGDGCLTGRPATGGTGVIPSCAAHRSGPVPAMGVTPGYLQLTDTAGNRAGSLLYNRPIPATAGVSITFDQYQYGGNGADGIGFFLVDGSTNLNATGGLGGSLGYAQRDAEPGVEGGYVGVGLDAFGNFYGDGESRGSGCPADQQSPQRASGANAPNIITVRGPGVGLRGYCWQGATVVSVVAQPVSTLDGQLRVNTQNPATAVRRVNVQVTPAPNPRIIVQVRYSATGPWITELDVAAPPGTPSTYKFGLSASTGGSNDVHLVRNVTDTIVPLAALQLEKQIDRAGAPLPPVITAGTPIPYLYTVTNAGEEVVSALEIADDTITGPITCEATTLQPAPAPGSTTVCRATYTVTADDVAAEAITNVATASGTTPIAGDVVSNEATVTVPLVSELALTKTVTTPGPYAVGQQVTYGYTVTNTGGTTLSTVNVIDNRVPTVVCATDVLAPDESTTCTAQYTVQSGHVDPDGYVRNVATARGTTPIGQTVVSNQAQAQIPVFTDVGVTKTVNDQAPLVGQNVTFTVTATNNGPSLATNVVLSDRLPAGRLTFVSAATTSGTYTQEDGLWRIPELAVGSSATLTLVATVDTNSEVANSATRTTMTQTDINAANDSASVTLNPITPSTDIAVQKSAADADVPLGSTTSYTVTATNNGPYPATGLTLRDTLPTSVTLVSATPSQGTFDAATGIWTIGALPVDGVVTLEMLVQPQELGRYTNIASLDTVSPGDTNPGNNQADATVTVRAPIADLAIAKGVLPEEAFVGDTVTYSATVTNLGPETVHDVFVTDSGPDGITVVDAEADQGTIDAGATRWDIGTLAPGATAIAIITATVDAPGTHVNTATVDSPSLLDPTPENNVDSATVVTDVAPLDIGVEKSVVVDSGEPDDAVPLGETVTFTLSATNFDDPAAPGALATNVILTDILPTGLTWVSTGACDGSFDEATGRWTVPEIVALATVTCEIQARADAVGLQTNSVSLVSLDQRDSNPTNNNATASITVVEEADLEVTKVVDQPVAQPGDTVTYTITITNLGPNDDENIEVVDPLPITANITGSTASGATTFDVEARRWTVGQLAEGQVETLTVEVLVSDAGGTFRNEVLISQARLPDPNLDNNRAFATLFVPVADIVVEKAVSDGAPYVGDEVTFTVAVTNDGPDLATDVTVDDLLPAGLTYVSSVASIGTYDAVTGVWTVGDLVPHDRQPRTVGAQATLTIVALVAEAGTWENTAASDRAESFPFDPDPTNNAATAVVVAQFPPTDVAVTKEATPSSVPVGGEFVFTIVVTVGGPGDADGVVLTDAFPDGVRPVSASASPDLGDGCTLGGQDLTCDLGDLVVGDEVVVQVSAVGEVPGPHTNVATVSTTSPEEIVENNTASVEVTVQQEPPGPGPGPGPAPGPAPGPGPGPGAGPDLPATGAQPLGVLVLGAVLALVGAVLLAASRRRPA